MIAAALVPLAVIAARRWQAGAWRELPEALRNGAWRPGAQAPEAHAPSAAALTIGRASEAFQRALPVLGIAGVIAWALFAPFHADVPPLRIGRAEAIAAADAALAARGVALGAAMAALRDGAARERRSAAVGVAQVRLARSGPEAYRRLVGTILAPPVWQVRYAMFGGDVIERAEEWRVAIANDGSVRAMSHALPEARPGARLSREAALALAHQALKARFGVDATPLTLVAADEQQRPARTDWSFVFGDPRIVVGAGGEARYVVAIAGDEVSGAGRFVHVPETWTRGEHERDNRLQVVALAGVAVVLRRAGWPRSSSASSAGSGVASMRARWRSCSRPRSSSRCCRRPTHGRARDAACRRRSRSRRS